MLYINAVVITCMGYIIKIGGSVISEEETMNLNSDIVREYSNILSNNKDDVDGIVVGGGNVAREYIETARELGASDEDQDILGICSTRCNAKLLQSILEFESNFIQSIDGLSELDKEVTPIMGGTEPDQTTDAVAVELASVLESSEILIASNVDGIYDTRGDKSMSDARVLDEISAVELQNIVSKIDSKPGRSVPIDSEAIEIAELHGKRLRMFNGKSADNIKKAVMGEEVGTQVTSKG
jgi:uridylate kinase